MSAARLANASFAAWRRTRNCSVSSLLSPSLMSPLLLHKMASSGDGDSGSTVTRKSSQLVNGGGSAPRGTLSPCYPFTYPMPLSCPCRSYTTSPRPRFVDIPVKSLSPKGCKDDSLIGIKKFLETTDLFERIKNHPLIPDEANAWRLTEAGEAFFTYLGRLCYFNSEAKVSVINCLNEELLKVSTRFCTPELDKNARGCKFDEKHNKRTVYNGLGKYTRSIVSKYYPELDLPEFEDYVTTLEKCLKDPSTDMEEMMVSNAALLSPLAAICCISRANLWLRIAVKKWVSGTDWSDRTNILNGIARAICGKKGETFMRIISDDPLLTFSEKVKSQREQQSQELQKLKGQQNNNKKNKQWKRLQKKRKQSLAQIGERIIAA